MIVNLALAPFDINFNVPCGVSWWCAEVSLQGVIMPPICTVCTAENEVIWVVFFLLMLFIYCCIAVEPQGLNWDSGGFVNVGVHVGILCTKYAPFFLGAWICSLPV